MADLSGLIREFERSVEEWRWIEDDARDRDATAAATLAGVRAEVWEAAVRMARKWEAALAEPPERPIIETGSGPGG